MLIRLVLLLALFTPCGTAQVFNDECTGAQTITFGRNRGYTTVNSTTSAPAWPCANGGNDVWFRFVATCSGVLYMGTCGYSNFNNSLELFSGSCGNLTSLACDDDGCFPAPSIQLRVSQGTTYYARVGGHNGAVGDFDLNLVCRPDGADECSGALDITTGINGFYENITATSSAPAWQCAAATNDIWFRYVAGCTGLVRFDTCGLWTYFDTVMEVFTGTCGSLTSVACNNDSCGTSSSIQLLATEGTIYYVRVGSYTGVRDGFFLYVTTPGNGNLQTLFYGCGHPTLLAAGVPNLGATMSFSLLSTRGVSLIWVGSQISVPLCPPATCTLGASFGVVVWSTSLQVTIPCDPALINARVAIQGADIGGPGGCPAGSIAQEPVSLSPTVLATIGG